MIQEILPKKFDHTYKNELPEKDSCIFCFYKEKVLLKMDEKSNIFYFPEYDEIPEKQENMQYLFSIDNKKFFLADWNQEKKIEGYSYENIDFVRYAKPRDLIFALYTAFHLYVWYRDNQYCGRCGAKVTFSQKERMLYCEECHNMIYPKIAPAVIVGIINGDKILMTKYAGRDYKKYALVAGFIEIGETAEEAVKREVMEEVGLSVKNIHYYKNQPWGLGSNLLLGYFAELDGTDCIKLDEKELSEAIWVHRDEMKEINDGISLTREMMDVFCNHQEWFKNNHYMQ